MSTYEVACLMLKLMGIGCICVIIAVVLLARKLKSKSVPGEKIYLGLFSIIGIFLLVVPGYWLAEERAFGYYASGMEESNLLPAVGWDEISTSFTHDGEKYDMIDLICMGSPECAFESSSIFKCYYYTEGSPAFYVREKDFVKTLLYQDAFVRMHEYNGPFESKLYRSSSEMFYCAKEEKEEIIGYYKNRSNYNSFLTIYRDEEDSFDKEQRRLALSLDEIEQLEYLDKGTQPLELEIWDTDGYDENVYYQVELISKDELVRGEIGVLQYNGKWYCNTYESPEDDYDSVYIIPLPDSISDKIDATL